MGDDQIPTELVAGKYRLTRLLGRGGMGSVWEGVHNTLGTRVACKFIDAEYADSEEARSRFENEARAAASLRSKHVVEVYDHGVTIDGRPYIVMEFLRGEPLDTRLERSGRLSLAETAGVIAHVARALAKAHGAGIVHRDLKPENIFLVWDEEDSADIAKVVDFGIAKFTDKSVGISSSTRTGSVLGTPYYMSPEQARGLRSVDYRSDLWSLGVIVFRCVTGRLPFEGEALGDLLVKLCTAPIPIPSQVLPGLPPSFDVWMARALSREPEGRFPDARTMAHELTQVAGGARAVMGSHADPEGTGPYHALGAVSDSGLSNSGARVTGSDMFTPQPASHGIHTPGPMQSSDAFAHSNNTNAALTATPPLPVKQSKAPLFAAGVAAVVVLGIGAAVLARSLGSDATAEAAASSDPSAPVVEAAAHPPAPAVEPVTKPEPAAAVEPEQASPQPVAAKPAAKKVSVSAKKSVSVPVVEPPPAAAPVPEPPKPEPVAAAPPPPAPKRVAPKPRATIKKPGIDVGY